MNTHKEQTKSSFLSVFICVHRRLIILIQSFSILLGYHIRITIGCLAPALVPQLDRRKQ